MAHTIRNITEDAIRLTKLGLFLPFDPKNKRQLEPNEDLDLTGQRTPSGQIFSSQRLRDAIYNGAVVFVVGGSPLTTPESIDYFTNYNFSAGGGAIPTSIEMINSDYSAIESKTAIIADAAANNIKITLPAAPTKGVQWIIKRTDKSNFTITVVATAPALLDGLTNSVDIQKTGPNKFNNSFTFLFDGNNYQII